MSNKHKDQLAKTLGVEEGSKVQDISKITGLIDYRWLYAILENLPIEKMNQLDICKAVYDRCIVKFSTEFFEERTKRMKYEKTIIDKVRIIDEQERELVKIRALLPEDCKTEALPNT